MKNNLTNKEIARAFNALGKIMELHGENPFKIRSYYTAYNTLRKWPGSLAKMGMEELNGIKGIGKAISSKIIELVQTGELQTYKRYAEKTPAGIITLLQLKGVGPKKIKQLWEELGIESAGELLYACNENRLIDLKGFGIKTQKNLISQLEYFIRSRGKFLYADVVDQANELIQLLVEKNPQNKQCIVGDLAKKHQIIENIEILTTANKETLMVQLTSWRDDIQMEGESLFIKNIPLIINEVANDLFVKRIVQLTSSTAFFNKVNSKLGKVSSFSTEEDLFESIGMKSIPPELRDDPLILDSDLSWLDNLISDESIRGLVHCHTQYSDGLNSLQEMQSFAQLSGLEYMVVTDHSKSAFYAGGLKEEDLIRQWNEIDNLNQKLDNFRIIKGIESDILNDGSLDYSEEILKQFEVIIASVHSNLKMDMSKANNRLIKAIENPYTSILGHPTGRLLLSRKGYPVDHEKVIDACAANGVQIELNSNPNRLDLDWKYIDYACSKGVLISINPDAHSIEGIGDIRYGICVARKAGLTHEMCLNTRSAEEFLKAIKH